MRATQGALIVASTLQMILGFSGLWRNVVRFLSPISAVPLVGLYLPHVIKLGENVFDRFAVIFAVVIVWIYAHLFTVGGAYNGAAPTTQTSCRTDRAGIVGAAPWVVWYWCWLLCLDVSISQMIRDSCREIAGLLAALTRVELMKLFIFNDMVNVPFYSEPFVACAVAFCLDNTLHKKRLFDKGEHWWDKFYLSSTRIDEFYFLPFKSLSKEKYPQLLLNLNFHTEVPTSEINQSLGLFPYY
uniref:Uncharacterized protein n=1 Tax=Brassica oleracea var. oleracea TaxID=109376 RepID=A0A0D3EE69_BRAOL